MPIISNFPTGAGLPDGGTEGQLLTMGAQGEAVWDDAPDTGVISFNGRKGAVTPESGDYTAEMVGAMTQEQGDGRYIQLEDGGTATMGESIGDGPFQITFEDDEDTELSAGEISYDNSTSGMSAVNTQDAIDELFQSVSEGKSLIAAAVTDKGVQTAATDTFAEMAENIEAIEGGTSLPALTSPGSAADLASGKQLIDQNGTIVTGSIPIKVSSTTGISYQADQVTPVWSGDVMQYISMPWTVPEDMILRKDGWFTLHRPLDDFGNAIATDVRAGKTFTSSAGVKVTGSAAVEKTATLVIDVSAAGAYCSICARGRGYGGLSITTDGFYEEIPVILNDVIAVEYSPAKLFSCGDGLSQISPTVTWMDRNYVWFQVKDLEKNLSITYG